MEHARRGFESFARECFDALRDQPGVHIELVKGSGPDGPRERSIPTLRRDRTLARAGARLTGIRAFRLEALAFGLSLQPLLVRRRPDIVYLSEWDTARVLAALRPVTGQDFKLLLCNGGFASEGFGHLDRVQELTPAGLEYVLERGADSRKHTVLPLGFHIQAELRMLSVTDRSLLRQRLGLPWDRKIVLSVAALNSHHKRLDYLIEELAARPRPRPFLLLLGEPDDETPALEVLARRRLGDDGYQMRTVALDEMPDYYRASDIFALASLVEAQGRVLVEAMSHGLPCIAHDSPVMRFALGDHGVFGDLTQHGRLAALLQSLLVTDPDSLQLRSREGHRYVYETFSWKRLVPRYVQLMSAMASGEDLMSGSCLRRE